MEELSLVAIENITYIDVIASIIIVFIYSHSDEGVCDQTLLSGIVENL